MQKYDFILETSIVKKLKKYLKENRPIQFLHHYGVWIYLAIE